jgi:sensor domain CHASE-containing protein
MDEFLKFFNDNLYLIAVGIVTLAFAIYLIVYFARSKSRKEKKDKARFEANMERIEKRLYKKCRHCGQNVPIEDNICQSCNQIPD